MNSQSVIPWEATRQEIVPASLTNPTEIANRAVQLRRREIAQIVSGFDAQHFEMVSTFVWSKALTALKRQLSTLGSDFIGEMLQRPDIGAGTDLLSAVTALEALSLAEDLGMISRTNTMRLRQAHETINHFSEFGLNAADDDDLDEGMTPEEAVGCLRACINGILGHPQLEVAETFANFRRQLEERTFDAADDEIVGLLNSPYFFLKTTLSVLLAMLRSASGAQLEHAARNTNVIVPAIWQKLRKPERWQAGQTYAELYSDGKKSSVNALKTALSRVAGFDYVPENLRSATFTRAAKAVLQAHEEFSNFYNEPGPMRELAALGTTIPNPAFPVCMTATLSVWLGNQHGHTWAAQDSTARILKSLSEERWAYYLEEVLPHDRDILFKFQYRKPSERWAELVTSFNIKSDTITDRQVVRLIVAGREKSVEKIQATVRQLSTRMHRPAA